MYAYVYNLFAEYRNNIFVFFVTWFWQMVVQTILEKAITEIAIVTHPTIPHKRVIFWLEEGDLLITRGRENMSSGRYLVIGKGPFMGYS